MKKRAVQSMSDISKTLLEGIEKMLREGGASKAAAKAEAARQMRGRELFPVRAYHGTRNDFEHFEQGDIGFHFGTAAQAEARLQNTRKIHGPEDENIMPVRLNIRNPLELPDVGGWGDPVTVAEALRKTPALADKKTEIGEILREAKKLRRDYYDRDDWVYGMDAPPLLDDLRSIVQGAGYDGIKYKNVVEGPSGQDSYIALDPRQVRSVHAKFDPKKLDSSDILAGVAGAGLAMPMLQGEPEAFANGGTAPMFDPEGPGYDLPSAQAAGMRPDAEGHMGSVAPTLEEQIYLLLKGRQHPTWDKAVDAENMRGSAVEKRDDGRYYSVPFAPGGGYADGGTPGHVHETRPTWTPPSFPELPTIHDLLMKREYTPAIINTLNPLATEGDDPLENTISRLGGLALSAAGTRLAAPVADLALDAGRRLYGGLSRAAPAVGAAAVMAPEDAEANPLKTKFLDMARAAATPKGTFSPAARAIASAPQDMTGEQWANFLRGRMADVGGQKFPVRPDELEFTGLGELLAQYGTKPVGRGALLDFLAAKKPASPYNEEMEQLYATAKRRGLTDQENERLAQLQEAANPDASPLLSRGAEYPSTFRFGDASMAPRARYPEHQLPGPREGYTEELTWMPGLGYKAPHFDARGSGLISHSRMSTRPTVDGGKAVHIDEIQSDLHQKARDEGGYRSADVEKMREVYQKYLREAAQADSEYDRVLFRALDETEHNGWDKLNPEQQGQIPELLEHRRLVAEALRRKEDTKAKSGAAYRELYDQSKKVPRAPYQDRYHEVEFNKALRRAVDEDLDYVTWTTGEQQAKRWNQQIQGGVKKLELIPHKLEPTLDESRAFIRARLEDSPGLNDNTKQHLREQLDRLDREAAGKDVVVTMPDGSTTKLVLRADGKYIMENGRGEAGTLQEFLGNSLAKKLEKEGVLEGENLSLGGGGFKNFYDGTINKYAESWARRFPGAEVKDTGLPGAAASNNDLAKALAPLQFQDREKAVQIENLDTLQMMLRGIEAGVPKNRARADAMQLLLDAGVSKSDAGLMLDTALVASQKKGAHKVHSLRLTPEMKAWIKQHGTPIMSVAPAAAVGSETLDRIEQLLGGRE